VSQERHSRRGPRTANHDIANIPREGTSFSHLTQVAAEAAAAATTGPLPIVTAPSEPILSGTSRQAHLHRKPRSGWLAFLMEHRGRFASFSVIGGGVFLLGLAMQVALVRDVHLDAIAAFFLQGFVSVQVSFLLNHFWTWRAERVPFWQACWKFNVSKVVTTIANLILYAGLVRAGMNYVVANVATTAVFTVVNYIVGHYWTFSSKTPAIVPVNVEDQALLALDLDVEPQPWWPSVSVVVPCKNNPGTIRATVDALLGQEYPALKEVILVGSTDDTTWTALADINDPRLELLEQSPVEGFRDPAVKRDKGVSKSSGDVIAFADSDIVMQPRWLARGVAALLAQGGGVVAGGMRSIHDTFWGRFVDQNRLGAKTPRLPSPYIVTAENFGRHHRKPPVTANMMLTRDVYQDQPIDRTWMYGYEDYEWFWRIARAGHRILFTDQLTGAHHHRRSFWHLVTEYRRAAFGCARFVRKHPDSPFCCLWSV
jgi:putative flippase GtrA/GT2 family glycosyltransferase